MPSIKGAGPTERAQLRIPQAPRFDRYGLHSEDCECTKCDLGMRPSPGERWAARAAWERAEERRKKEAERAAAGLPKRERKRQAHAAALAEQEKFTDHLIAKLNKPVERPATADELAELRAEYPNLKPKGKP